MMSVAFKSVGNKILKDRHFHIEILQGQKNVHYEANKVK